jgi:hypothetical protein
MRHFASSLPETRVNCFQKRLLLNPAILTLLAASAMVAVVLIREGGDPLALARLGTIYSQGDPAGTQGYDGQFVYYIARDLDPASVAPFLDVASYRYQRILLPLLARLFAFGSDQVLLWILPAITLISQALGTWFVAELLTSWGVSRWYALIFGLWVGFVLAIRLDLPEPLAYALIAGGFYADSKNHPELSYLLYGFAIFAKEVVLLFVLASFLEKLLKRRWRQAVELSLVALVPYMIFQIWLTQVFGSPGIGSGGAMATPFEIIPFKGIMRISHYSQLYLLAMLAVFGPAVILPVLWGIWAASKKLLEGDINFVVLALFLNGLLIPFLPFSTFRETGGLLRISCGLVLAIILFAGRYRIVRVLNYSYLLLVLNVFLLKS